MPSKPIAQMTLEERIGETLTRTVPRLGPEFRSQFNALISPEALTMMAGMIVAWIASHAIGLGQIIDVLMIGVGIVSIGWAVFVAIDHLYRFAHGVYTGRNSRSLDVASEHLAEAVAILGR